MTVRTGRRRAARILAGTGAAALLATGLMALPAAAAPATVEDVTFSWSVNDESGGGSFFGGCNFLIAGKVGDVGSSKVWGADEAEQWYRTEAGDVSIRKPDASGGWITPTWDDKCLDARLADEDNPHGVRVTTGGPNRNSTTKNEFVFTGGSGTVDLEAGTGEVAWEGDVSIVYYGGMTYWSFSDPVLTLDGEGGGRITATASGYGASMADPSLWQELEAREITLADLSDVELTEEGFTVTPDYLGVETDPGDGAQDSMPPRWDVEHSGSFPQSWVDFGFETGQGSYWYSSGGVVDRKKPTNPLTVAWNLAEGPRVTLSRTTFPAEGETTVTVTGTGFTPTSSTPTRPPLAGMQPGAYVAFGDFGEQWRPSEGAPTSARTVVDGQVVWALPAESRAVVGENGTALIDEDGSFEVELTISRPEEITGNLGVYTYPGGGARVPAYETYTPVSFGTGAGDVEIGVEVPEGEDPGGPGGPGGPGEGPEPEIFELALSGQRADLGRATAEEDGSFSASGTLPTVTVTDTREVSASWAVTGRAGDFTGTGTIPAGALGWSPHVGENTAGAVAGEEVEPGEAGLGEARVLVEAPADREPGSVEVGAGLQLRAPSGTPAGSYTSLLTLTLVG